MAKKKYDGPIDRFTDFTDADPNQPGVPASGKAVQTYIKSIDTKKIGVGMLTKDETTHLFFADEHDRDLYTQDPTRTDLIIDQIALTPAYRIEISPISPINVSCFVGTVGNVISYSFRTVNRSDAEVNDPIIATYKISRGTSITEVTETYESGTIVQFNVDKYLLEGTNRIDVSIVGQVSNQQTGYLVTYQVVSMELKDTMDIATIHNATDPNSFLLVPVTVSGVGQRHLYWWLDGVQLDHEPGVDDITETGETPRIKNIPIHELTQGTHNIQFRAGIIVDGEEYLTTVRYREFIISQEELITGSYTATAVNFPDGVEPLSSSQSVVIYYEQYIPYHLRLAAWTPSDPSKQNDVVIKIGETTVAQITTSDNQESDVEITFNTAGAGTLSLIIGSARRDITTDISVSSMDLNEITDNLILNLTGQGMSNDTTGRESWTDGTYHAALTGFDFTNASGWVDNSLKIPSGASINFSDYAPLLVNPINRGFTLEMEFNTYMVEDDSAVLMDLINDVTGAGIMLTATEIIIRSRDRVNLRRRFKTEEDLRVSFVINRQYGVSMSAMVMVYINGIMSMCDFYPPNDSFACTSNLSIGGVGAGIILKQLRIYGFELNSDMVINNYILYRPDLESMLDAYNRNDLYEENTTSIAVNKISAYLPVMIITGDISEIENATTTDPRAYVDIEYINLQAPEYSFKVHQARLRPQGTSSLLYPRKNLRLYTNKDDRTIFYDYQGNVVADRKYAFKPNAQRVDCWTLKADFAESSSTHNTGVARIWNDKMYDTVVNGSYVLRTAAQAYAREQGINYDVRTTVDGFPIVIFHHVRENDPLTFLGKYNFNNDKSTPSVFGFEGIGDFDNTNVECWEFRDSAADLALFETNESVVPAPGKTKYETKFDDFATDYENKFKQVWERRYPDDDPTQSSEYEHFRRLASWINSTEGASELENGVLVPGDPERFAEWQENKGNYFDLPKLAAYYVYLMRFGAVDQTVKNAMITTEDGVHWFFINYDNDTILGLDNEGRLNHNPDIDRQSMLPDGSAYRYAGHDSVLWNNFEADPECMALVRQIDSAMAEAGLNYSEMIEMFNEEQSSKWSERVHNSDSIYKYIDPYRFKGSYYLDVLQGSRSDHRKWWISNRFALYDAKYTNTTYLDSSISFRCHDAREGDEISIAAGKDFYYGWGQNRQPVEVGVYLESGESYDFAINQNFNEGTPIRLYAPYYIREIDLGNFAERGLSTVELTNINSETLGTLLRKLKLSKSGKTNTLLSDISGLSNAVSLEELDIEGFSGLSILSGLNRLQNLKTLKANNSGLTSVSFASGAPLTTLQLPATISVMTLADLPLLQASGISMQKSGGSYALRILSVQNCAGVTSDFSFIKDWLTYKSSADDECTLTMNGISWNNVSFEDFDTVLDFAENGGHLELAGKVYLTGIGHSQENAEKIRRVFGPDVFNPSSAFYVYAPADLFLSGPASINEGENATYELLIIGGNVGGTVNFDIESPASHPGASITKISDVRAELTTTEIDNFSTTTYTIGAVYSYQGQYTVRRTTTIVNKRTYPSSYSISGNAGLQQGSSSTFTLEHAACTGEIACQWNLSGDIAIYGAEITAQDDSSCTIYLDTLPESAPPVISGTLTGVLTKKNTGASLSTVTLAVGYTDDTIAVSSYSNPYAMAVLYAALHPLGKCEHSDRLTKDEAALVTDADITVSSTKSIFSNNSNFKNYCTSFDELQYFVRLTSIIPYMFEWCSALEHVVIPSGVVSIGAYAFSYAAISEINIPNGVIWIDGYAFSYCNNLVSAVIPGTFSSTGQNIFINCTSLTTVSIGQGVTSLPNGMFSGCTSLNSLNLPSSLTSIGINVFYGCTSLTSFVCPSGLVTFGHTVFRGCTSLSSFTFNEGFTTLYGGQNFKGCTSLTTIHFPASLSSTVSTNTFEDSGVVNLTIASGNQTYYDGGGNCVIRRSDNALVLATNGTASVPSGVVSIETYAFPRLNITSLVVPESVTVLKPNSIDNCTQLTEIECLGSTAPTVYAGTSSYSGTFSVIAENGTLIYTSGSNYNYWLSDLPGLLGYYNWNSSIVTIDGLRYRLHDNNLEATVLKYTTGSAYSGDIVIPSYITYDDVTYSVTVIDNEAFRSCSGVTSVVMPNTITKLIQYDVSSGGIPISTGTFFGCSNMTEVTISTGLTEIPDNTFRGVAVKDIVVPASISSFGGECFGGNSALESLTIMYSSGVIAYDSCLYGSTTIQHIYVSASLVDSYKAASGWVQFASKIEAIQ